MRHHLHRLNVSQGSGLCRWCGEGDETAYDEHNISCHPGSKLENHYGSSGALSVAKVCWEVRMQQICEMITHST